MCVGQAGVCVCVHLLGVGAGGEAWRGYRRRVRRWQGGRGGEKGEGGKEEGGRGEEGTGEGRVVMEVRGKHWEFECPCMKPCPPALLALTST